MTKHRWKRLFAITLCLLVSAGLLVQPAFAAKAQTNPAKKLLIDRYRSPGDPRYESSFHGAGETMHWTFDTYVQTYDESKGAYVFTDDVVDSAKYTLDKVTVNPASCADYVQASFSGNVLTVKTDPALPEECKVQVYYTVKAAGLSESPAFPMTLRFYPDCTRIEVQPGFLFPFNGQTSKLDLKVKQYKDGQITELTDRLIEVEYGAFDEDDDPVLTITDANGGAVASGDRIGMDQLPLTVSNATDAGGITLRALPEDEDQTERWDGWLFMDGAYEDCENPYFRDVTVSLSPKTVVYNGKAQKPAVTAKYGNKTIDSFETYTFDDVQYYYLNNTKVGTATVLVVFYEENVGVVPEYGIIRRATFRILPPAPAITSVLPPAANKGLNVTWKKVSGVTGYRVYRDGKAIATIKGAANTSYLDPDAKANGTRYSYKVRAYKTVSGKNYWSANSAGKSYIFLARTAITALTNPSSKAMKVTWKKNAKADGYQIQYATNAKFSGKTTVKVTDAATVSKTIKSLTKGKTYYVRVRSYKGGAHSAWSSVKKVTIAK